MGANTLAGRGGLAAAGRRGAGAGISAATVRANTAAATGVSPASPPATRRPTRSCTTRADRCRRSAAPTLIPRRHRRLEQRRVRPARARGGAQDVLVYTTEPLADGRRRGRHAWRRAARQQSRARHRHHRQARRRPSRRPRILICDGILALRHRDDSNGASTAAPAGARSCGRARPDREPVLPGPPDPARLSSSNFPRFARNPNDGTRPTQAASRTYDRPATGVPRPGAAVPPLVPVRR